MGEGGPEKGERVPHGEFTYCKDDCGGDVYFQHTVYGTPSWEQVTIMAHLQRTEPPPFFRGRMCLSPAGSPEWTQRQSLRVTNPARFSV